MSPGRTTALSGQVTRVAIEKTIRSAAAKRTDIPRGRSQADCPMGVFPPTRERCYFLLRQCPCIRSRPGQDTLVSLGPDTSLSMLGRDRIERIPSMTARRWPTSCSSLNMHDSHRHLRAARQALANMLSGAKSVRRINSWPQLLVRPLDSGRSLASKVYLTSRLGWLARTLRKPAQRRFLARPRRQGYFPFHPLPGLPYLPV